MATTEQIEKIRAALDELNAALNGAKGESAGSGVQTLASGTNDATETSEYLGNAGLAELARLVRAALDGKKDKFTEGYGLALEDGVLKVTLDTSLFVVVRELPTEPTVEDEGKLHLVPMGETEEGNEYAEWLWVNGAWELMGTLHTKVDLSDYLPLSGGTLTGELTVKNTINCQGNLLVGANMTVYDEVQMKSDLDVEGATSLNLTENADAPSVVVTDDDGKLYKAPVSQVGGGDYLPIDGGTLTGAVSMGDTGFRITAEGHLELPSGVEIW